MRPTFRFTTLCWLIGLLALGAASRATNTPGITLIIDCPACGPGQSIPHQCPRGAPPPVPATPDPLPPLLESARSLHRRFNAIDGFSLPPLAAPASLPGLAQTLAVQLAAARAEVARIEREQTVLTHGVVAATAEAKRLATHLTELTAAVAQVKDQLTALPAETAEAQRRAIAAREEFLAWQKTHATWREQIRQARNRLFPRLQLAATRGWLLPPSSYRELPAPLPVQMRELPRDRADAAADLVPQARYRSSARVEESPAALPRSAPNFTNEGPRLAVTAGETDVRTKLNEFEAVHYRAYAAAALRADATQAGIAARHDTAALTARIASIESDLARLQSQRDEHTRRLAHAQQVAATELARLHDMRQRALTAWIECGIYRVLVLQAETALTHLLARNPDPSGLRALRTVAETTAQLGARPAGLIARRPPESTARRDTLAAIRRELAALRAAPELTVKLDRADLPAALQPYWPEDRP